MVDSGGYVDQLARFSALSRGKELCVLAAAKEKQVLATVKFDDAICATPVAANGVLYVNTLKTLYALAAR